MRRRLAALGVLLLTACPLRRSSGPGGTHAATVEELLQEGSAQLDARDFAGAARSFESARVGAKSANGAALAEAFFGLGVAAHELWRQASDSGADSASAGGWATAVHAYGEAAHLDSARYFHRASYNAGILNRQLGRHTAAAQNFVDAAATAPDSERTQLLLWAVRELQAASRVDRDSGGALYRRTMRALASLQSLDTSASAVRLTLAGDPDVVGVETTLAWLTRLAEDSTNASEAATTAIAALAQGPAGVPQKLADSLLHLAARANVTARTSPEIFARDQSEMLAQVGQRQPRLAEPIRWLQHAYGGDSVGSLGASPTTTPGWWAAPDRRRTWSSLLRVIGEWDERFGRDSLARSYYESAIGRSPNEIGPWSDLDAVPPLLLLYDRAADSSAANAARLDRFLETVFNEKALAYQRGEIERIRQFHTALGGYYARHERWRGAPRGAIFQLEGMRSMTRALGGTRQGFVDSPELLEQLVRGYLATGDTAKARAVLPALDSASASVGAPAVAARWRARLDSLGGHRGTF